MPYKDKELALAMGKRRYRELVSTEEGRKEYRRKQLKGYHKSMSTEEGREKHRVRNRKNRNLNRIKICGVITAPMITE